MTCNQKSISWFGKTRFLYALTSFLGLFLCPNSSAQIELRFLSPEKIKDPGWHECVNWKYSSMIHEEVLSWDGHLSIETECVAPDTFIKTSSGGRVMYLKKKVWDKNSGEISRFGSIFYHESNCDAMESRFIPETTITNYRPGLPLGVWEAVEGEDYAVALPKPWQFRFSSWKVIRKLKPVDRWICERHL